MSKKQPRTLADYRAAHDPSVIVPSRIRAALAAMVKEGRENWEYEAEFMKRAALSPTQMGQFREQFAAHIVLAPGRHQRNPKRIWFGDLKAAAHARGS